MANYFSDEAISMMEKNRTSLQTRIMDMRSKYLFHAFQNEQAREHAVHGLCRRLTMLVRCIDRVFTALPPDRDEIPTTEEIDDATIAIQSFVFNTFGCLDNLAWIWVYEKNVRQMDGKEIERKQVGLDKKRVKASFSTEFQSYLESRKAWFDHIKGFRDALAHRIPLYIPPHIVDPQNTDAYNELKQKSAKALQLGNLDEYDHLQSEQKKFAQFRPWMTHSLNEQAPTIVFHPQLLQDYATIEECADKLINEIGRKI